MSGGRVRACRTTNGLKYVLARKLSVVKGGKWRVPELSRQPLYQPVEGISGSCHAIESLEIHQGRLRQACLESVTLFVL